MPENEILAEIHRHREELARSCGYDVKKLMDYYRHREAQPEAPEHELVSYNQTSVKPGFWSGDNRNLKSRFLAQVQP